MDRATKNLKAKIRRAMKPMTDESIESVRDLLLCDPQDDLRWHWRWIAELLATVDALKKESRQ